MHVHLPKPLHGWRAFVGEVGIIVLGVLIALGAEQVVESVHWHSEARDFRAALDSELSYDLWTYRYRMMEGPCVRTRLDQLQQWLDQSRAGKGGKLSGPISMPMRLSPRTSAWQARTGDIANHIPLQTRLAYGELYDGLANFEDHAIEERGIWRDLGDFEDLSNLSREEQVRLGGLIRRERVLDSTVDLNWKYLARAAGRIGVHAVSDPTDPTPPPEFCQPIHGGA